MIKAQKMAMGFGLYLGLELLKSEFQWDLELGLVYDLELAKTWV